MFVISLGDGRFAVNLEKVDLMEVVDSTIVFYFSSGRTETINVTSEEETKDLYDEMMRIIQNKGCGRVIEVTSHNIKEIE